MTLSPFEAERREFGRTPFGYRPRDVDHFVEEVQRSLRDLWQERSDTREENERLKERLTRFEQLEDQLKNTLLLAQDSAEKAHEQARRESELVMREAGQKSRDIVHAAHEDKQRLEMVLRDLHSAEQEARQRLRAMSSAILSHLDDTEQLVAESSGTFRAIVQAHPEATILRSASAETMSDVVERAALVAEAAVVAEAGAHADRVALDAEHAAIAADRIEVEQQDRDRDRSRPARMRRTGAGAVDTTDALAPMTRTVTDALPEVRVSATGTTAIGATADAFFDAPPSFDPSEVARRDRVTPAAE